MTKDNEQFAKENEEAREEMAALEKEDEVPSDLAEWPDGRAKNLTFGSAGDEPYGEGATAKLGPASVEHHEDGSVSVGGEQVDDPENYKGEPIPDPRETSIPGRPDPVD
ncbi:MAG: hypothetical protein H0V81_07575 [Solirubrobacterales bacterium]|nr:hypothetical protein [Solirubrobacterales bacterium]